jgi:hypothetical protein
LKSIGLESGIILWETVFMAYRQIPIEQMKANLAASRLKDKPTSEQIRLEAEKLRDTAVKLLEHAATLMTKATELEKQIAGCDKPKPSRK